MTSELELPEFLECVKDHQMFLLRDDGLYRHVRFQQPNSNARYFDLITWPGHLCYTGDMGTFVFAIGGDMFWLFRTDEGKIRPDYWGQKLLAVDSNGSTGSAVEFDREAFIAAVNEQVDEWCENLTAKEQEDLREQVQACVLNLCDESHEQVCYSLVYEFRACVKGREFWFDDLFDRNFTKPTYHYLWCCYAIVWGIHKWDKAKERGDA